MSRSSPPYPTPEKSPLIPPRYLAIRLIPSGSLTNFMYVVHSVIFRYIPLHSGTLRYFRYIPVHSVTFRYIPLHSPIFRYTALLPVHSCTFRCIPLYSVTFPYIPVHCVTSCTFRYIPLHSPIFRYTALLPVHSCTFRYIPSHFTSIGKQPFSFKYCNSFSFEMF